MEKKHTPTVYYCKTRTEATDRANLYYIASPTARRIETNEHPKSKNKFAYIIRYQKKLQKYQKKFAKLFFCCTFVPETKNNIPC